MQKIVNTGVYCIIATVAVSVLVRVARGQATILETKLPLMDLIIWAVLALWVLKLLVNGGFSKIILPPAPVWAFVIAAALSTINAKNLTDSAKEIIQFVSYFLIAFTIFINNIKTSGQITRAVHVYCGITIVIVAIALSQDTVQGRES
jgi:hypothetical protein